MKKLSNKIFSKAIQLPMALFLGISASAYFGSDKKNWLFVFILTSVYTILYFYHLIKNTNK